MVLPSQTGQLQPSRHHITERGSWYLRHTRRLVARSACVGEGDLRDDWLRRKRQGLHPLAAVTAVAVKRCGIVWRIMTDRRDYLPQRPASKQFRG